MNKFKILWDNGHACDAFSIVFDTEEEAKAYGENWMAEMIAMDDDREAATEAYAFEVIPAEQQSSDEDEDFGENDTPQQMGWVGGDGRP